MVNYAKITNDKFGERKLLDIVFIGDSFVERWNGTRSLGQEVIPGMRTPFEKRFTRTGGGAFEGIALGSSGDTVSCNIERLGEINREIIESNGVIPCLEMKPDY